MEKQTQLNVLFEDANILVLNKPSGIVVNRSKTTKAETLQDMIETYLHLEPYTGITEAQIAVDVGDDEVIYDPVVEFKQRSGIMHRIDKDTSGVVLVAKDASTFAQIKKQFLKRSVHKEYLAIVTGEIKEQMLSINAPLKRSPKNPFKYGIAADGREALTDMEKLNDLIKNDRKYTLLKVFPKTGRTHQIRVHCAALNHPIAGDVLYCTRQQFDVSNGDFGRLMLHSALISFIHPTTHSVISIKSPVPSDFIL